MIIDPKVQVFSQLEESWKLSPAYYFACASVKWSDLYLLSGSRCCRLRRLSGCFCQQIDGAAVGTDRSRFRLLVSSAAARNRGSK